MHEQPPIVERLPELLNAIISSLGELGRSEIAQQLRCVSLKSASYDSDCDAGYLYVTQSRELNIAEKNTIRVQHSECICFDKLPGTVVIDVDNLNRVMGIELIGHPEVFKRIGVA